MFGVDLSRAADALVGGFALAAGVLVAVFTQLAGWRTRLDDRAEVKWRSEAPARRLVDAAVAHALVGVLASMFALVAALLLTLDAEPRRFWNGVAALLTTYVVGLFVTLVRSVFAGYESNVDEGVREADMDLLDPPDDPSPPHPAAPTPHP